MTEVVNIRNQSYDVYMGRAGKGFSGYFGNPIKAYSRCARCNQYHDTGESTLGCYSLYFHERLLNDSEFKQRVLSLKGKVLGCFCKPRKCHVDIIIDWLDGNQIEIDYNNPLALGYVIPNVV